MRIGKQPEATPITDLQEMLRMIYPDDFLSKDGLFGSETKKSVERFQKEQGLPMSGVADLQTWEAIEREYQRANVLQGPAEPLFIILQPNQVIEKGSENTHLYLLQGVLTGISRYYEQMPIVRFTGILDEPTAEAISWLQDRAGLPATGELDKVTWRHLAKLYRLIVGDGSGQYPIRMAQNPKDDTPRT